MNRGGKRLYAAGAAVLGVVGLTTLAAPSGSADVQTYDSLVSETPAPVSANVMDGTVRQVATVGGVTVAVGKFTQVESRGSSTVETRNNIFAFDSSGQVSETFVPVISGSEVYDVLPSGDGHSVYVAGNFSSVNGANRTNKIARIDVNTGQVISSFKSPAFNQRITDIQLINGRLYVGGWFTTSGATGATTPRSMLTSLDPTTGADLGGFTSTFTGTWNGGVTGITHFTISPDGRTLVAIGNFTAVDGQSRPQIAMFDLTTSPYTLSSWATQGLAKTCSAHFKTYVNDVDVDPTSSYFVVGSTGAYSGGPGAGTLCDAVARFELGRTGAGQAPTWVHYTGGDTVTQVEATGNAIYIGGHFRWLNNPFIGDRPGPGNVKRQGLGALDPRNGQPYSWAPQMRRHWGVFGMNSTPTGLWVTYDSDAMNGDEYHRIAFFPLTTDVVPTENLGTLPGAVYLLGAPPSAPTSTRILYRVNAGGPTLLSNDAGPDWQGDTASAPSPRHNSGSSTSEYNYAVTRGANLPTDTPIGLFTTERWDSTSQPEMQWDFPVAAGTPVQVRLFFGNQCSCTNTAGKRLANVFIDGVKVLSNYDIVADTGNLTATMKAFNVVSDGNIDVDFGHVVQNPLVNGIEIVRTDVPDDTPAPDTSAKVVGFDGTNVTSTSTDPITLFTSDWHQARGAFMVGKDLYTGWSDGTMKRRVWNGSKFLGATTLPVDDLGSWQTELEQVRSMFYDASNGFIYYTLNGSNQLYYRPFTTQSGIVGGLRFNGPGAGAAGIDWTTLRGAFLTGNQLYYTTADGTMYRVQWAGGAPVAGTVTAVSGPGIDGQDWRSQALFLRAG